MAQKNTQTLKNTPVEASPQKAGEPMVKETRNGLNFFLSSAATVPANVAAKTQFMGEVRQRLAEAHDLELQGGEKAVEAQKIASSQIIRLFRARAESSIGADELNGLLLDIYGSKPKKDGTPSKTPEGLGKAIRDRVIRLYNASEHANGRDGTAFFDNMPKDEVTAIINYAVQNNAPWEAHQRFSELKSKITVRPSLAFDPARILKLAASLDEEGAAETVRSNPKLRAAYGELIASLAVIGQADEEETEMAA
jgi:hypothetical protein